MFLAILLAVFAGFIYLVALFPINLSKNENYRAILGFTAFVLGLIHGILMINLNNLSLIEFSTYQKCLPIILGFALLTAVSISYQKIVDLLPKYKKPFFID
jgi:hypothetical protein